MPDVETGPITPLDAWKLHLARMPDHPQILYFGAKHWPGSVVYDHSIHCRRGVWIGSDIEAGDGVEIVGDIETLTSDRKFDGIYCQSVLEHVARPWLAMRSMAGMLRPGGTVFVGTHQTFPLHGYPLDYFRFSIQALESMAVDAGLITVASGYDVPCTITPARSIVWNEIAKAFLDVSICASRT